MPVLARDPRKDPIALAAAPSRIGLPADAAPYWRDLLLRCGLDTVAPTATTATAAPGVCLVPPGRSGHVAELRAAARAGTILIGDARTLAPLLPAAVHTTRVGGIAGQGVLFEGCARIRMPGHVSAYDGRLVALVRRRGEAPILTLPLVAADELLAPRARFTELDLGSGRSCREILPAVDHGGLRRLVENALAIGHALAGRVMVQLAPYPAGYSGMFAFRVDADSFDAGATAAVVESLRRADLRATWFIDVERHAARGGRDAVAALPAAGHEVQSHYHHHYTYAAATRNRANLARSLDVLAEWGILASAAAAPFGTWHRGVADAVVGEKLAWSSEFAAIHDDHPTRCTGSLQVPIHPVCPAQLLAAGFGRQGVSGYFRQRLRESLHRHDTTVLYGHPIGDLAACPDLLPELRDEAAQFAAVAGAPLWQPTLGELVAFHRLRWAAGRDAEGVFARSRRVAGEIGVGIGVDDCGARPWSPPRHRRAAALLRFRRWLREARGR